MRTGRRYVRSVARQYRLSRAVRVAVRAYDTGSAPQPLPSQPVIVVGMHRSGTSVTARVLSSLGIDMGRDTTEQTHESIAYRNRNEAVLAAAGASWDHPRPFVLTVADPTWRLALGTTLEASVRAPWRWWLRDPHAGGHGPSQWGWKDPRNSITWPLWLDIFPDARVVRVTRHHDDVVASLVTRSKRLLHEQRRPSFVTATMDGAVALVDEYAASLAALDVAAPGQIVDVHYEELVDSPIDVIARLASDLDLDPARVPVASNLVQRRRS